MRSTFILGTFLALLGLGSLAQASERSDLTDRDSTQVTREVSNDRHGERHDRDERKDRSRDRHDETHERRSHR